MDTHGWTSGIECLNNGFTAEDGCTANGWNCDKYSKKVISPTGFTLAAWCADGSPLPKFKDQAEKGLWPFGQDNNSPETNCCVCGKTGGILKTNVISTFLKRYIAK